METPKNLIIHLLVQDMKHEQLINGLTNLGFESQQHTLDIMAVVSGLMHIAPEKLSWHWCDAYMAAIKQARQYPITTDGQNLLPLAEQCFAVLETCT